MCHMRRRIHVSYVHCRCVVAMRRRIHVSYEEEDTCVLCGGASRREEEEDLFIFDDTMCATGWDTYGSREPN